MNAPTTAGPLRARPARHPGAEATGPARAHARDAGGLL